MSTTWRRSGQHCKFNNQGCKIEKPFCNLDCCCIPCKHWTSCLKTLQGCKGIRAREVSLQSASQTMKIARSQHRTTMSNICALQRIIILFLLLLSPYLMRIKMNDYPWKYSRLQIGLVDSENHFYSVQPQYYPPNYYYPIYYKDTNSRYRSMSAVTMAGSGASFAKP